MPYQGLLIKYKIKCLSCNKEIIRDHSNRKYCDVCSKKRQQLLKKRWKREHYQKTYSTNICVICTKLFNSKKSTKKFCSNECANKQHKINRYLKRIQFLQKRIREMGGLLQ